MPCKQLISSPRKVCYSMVYQSQPTNLGTTLIITKCIFLLPCIPSLPFITCANCVSMFVNCLNIACVVIHSKLNAWPRKIRTRVLIPWIQVNTEWVWWSPAIRISKAGRRDPQNRLVMKTWHISQLWFCLWGSCLSGWSGRVSVDESRYQHGVPICMCSCETHVCKTRKIHEHAHTYYTQKYFTIM